MKIRTFELCAGYDSQLMALERLKKKHSDFDYECIGWSEIEPSAITLHNACFPSLSGKNFGDMTKIDWSKVADFDLLTYSTPCQSVSQAGMQEGIEEGSNTRSSILWFTRNAIITKRPKIPLNGECRGSGSNKVHRVLQQVAQGAGILRICQLCKGGKCCRLRCSSEQKTCLHALYTK